MLILTAIQVCVVLEAVGLVSMPQILFLVVLVLLFPSMIIVSSVT